MNDGSQYPPPQPSVHPLAPGAPQVVYSAQPGAIEKKDDGTTAKIAAALIVVLLGGGGTTAYSVVTARDAARVSEGHSTHASDAIARLEARDEEKTRTIERLEGVIARLEQIVTRLDAEKKAEEKISKRRGR
jgi:uncharacterized protein HemX